MYCSRKISTPGYRYVHIVLRHEEKKRYNMTQAGNLETEREEVGYGGGKMSLMCARRGSRVLFNA